MPRFNVRTAYEKEKDQPFFSRSSKDQLASWRLSGIQGPRFEQWYFDSVSNDGESSFSLIFARDASYAALGQGHLRMEFDAVLPDGSRFRHAEFMSEAALEDSTQDVVGSDVGRVRGIWTAPGTKYGLSIKADGSIASADFQGARVRGSFRLRSTAPPHYPNGLTHSQAGTSTSTELCPKINLVEVIPSGVFECDVVLDGKALKFTGIGGHMHIWAEDSWFSTVREWRMCRAVAGPYSFSFMQWVSQVDGRTYSSGFVAERGEKAFGALEVHKGKDKAPDMDDSKVKVRWTPIHNVGVSGAHADKSSGAVVHFQADKEFRFELTFRQLAISVNFGGGHSGLSVFHCHVSGGDIDEGWVKVYFFAMMILAKLTFGYIDVLGNGYM
ncbi:hypothetical protein DHEL01_v212906 [Diaporthe helianthi]|uniref:Uncharacterized protein n=1 Tax=Diaporthe helianthi TaxID=158607 RepID=A0A2P5HEM7_DIAHE|nr:hypothetical protein DHEL01_v212906 [Diaporthe helianthi]